MLIYELLGMPPLKSDRDAIMRKAGEVAVLMREYGVDRIKIKLQPSNTSSVIDYLFDAYDEEGRATWGELCTVAPKCAEIS